ncbi:MAG: nuclear transport factor 2 family protein [Saprospiraceae bacterium]|nr:nuclear transport factor 2 family protein [Saprospiraceae bacterium]
MKHIFLIMLFPALVVCGQTAHKNLIFFNQEVDNAVIERDIDFLEKAFADDFVFYHGTGLIDGKKEWIANAKNVEVTYLQRQHDSIHIDLHKPDIFIVYGKLFVEKESKGGRQHYTLWYQRVYRKKKKLFEMLSHHTMREVDF